MKEIPQCYCFQNTTNHSKASFTVWNSPFCLFICFLKLRKKETPPCHFRVKLFTERVSKTAAEHFHLELNINWWERESWVQTARQGRMKMLQIRLEERWRIDEMEKSKQDVLGSSCQKQKDFILEWRLSHLFFGTLLLLFQVLWGLCICFCWEAWWG